MQHNTAQKLEEVAPNLRLAYSQDTTADLRETREQTKNALLREIDNVIRKYKPNTTSDIENLEKILSEYIFTEKLPEDSVTFHASELIVSKISKISMFWENLQSGLMLSEFTQPKLPVLNIDMPKFPVFDLGIPKVPTLNLGVASLPSSYYWASLAHRDLFENDPKPEFDDSQTVISLDTIHKELQDLSDLEDNWDGHDGYAISKRACNHAWSFIKLLGNKANRFEPFPDPDGSVGLEYHDGGNVSAYFNFSAGGELSYVVILGDVVHRGHGIHVEDELPSILRSIVDAIY